MMTRRADRTSEGSRGGRRAPLLFSDTPIDQPGLIAHGALILKGWAASPRGIAGVTVQIDGRRRLQASHGLDTPWVAEAIPDLPGAEAAGYELRLDTSGWAPGTRRVTITATDRRGRRSAISGQIEILPFVEPRYTVEDNLAALARGEPVMWLEEPRLVDRVPEVTGSLEVTGWAHSAQGIDSVVVVVDHRARHEALHPITRGDLLAEYGPDVAKEAGFLLSLDQLELSPGTHDVSVVAVARDGQAVGVEGEILLLPETGPSDTSREPAAVEWLSERRAPRLRRRDERPGVGVADGPAERLLDPERELRYRWAAELARDRDVLDVGGDANERADLFIAAGARRLECAGEGLDDLRLAGGSFDLVICFDLLQRLPEPAALIEEMRRLLRAGGVLLASVPGHGLEPGDAGRRRGPMPEELEGHLRDRFQNVAVHRQQTWLRSSLLDEGRSADPDGDVDLEIDVRGLAANPPGDEDHLVAIASDDSLPAAPRMGLLASAQPVRESLAIAIMWEDRAHLAEADAAASRTQANLAQMHQKSTLEKLREAEAMALRAEALEASLSWRITRPLRSLRRRLSSFRAAE